MTKIQNYRSEEEMVRKNNDGKKRCFAPKKTRSGGGHQDDDSVDSNGNIRGLINYDYDSEESEIVESDDSSYKPSNPIVTTKNAIAYRTRNSKRLEKNKHINKSHVKKTNKIVEEEVSDEYESESEDERANEKMVTKLLNEKRRLKKLLDEKNEKVKSSKKKKVVPAKKSSKYVIESDDTKSSTMEEEDDEDEDEYDEDDEDEDDVDMEDDESIEEKEPAGIIFSFGGDDSAERMVPKRHNMKKESDEVKKFVKLLTTPTDEDTIDGQIDQFKALPDDQRTKLLNVLESRNKVPGTGNTQQSLMFKILTMNLPETTQSMVLTKYNSLQSLDPGSSEYFKLRNWLEKVTSMPLGVYKQIPVKITDGSEVCGSFMEKARKALDDAIYGQDEAKLQILQFIGTKIANPSGSGLSLLLAGPPGIGKTSLIKNGVAKALQWPFQFISLGGDSDASTYTGHQLVYESSHCGKIVNSLCAAKSMSMVLMFDELDKISATPKGEEVQNLLVHLTDPVQNSEFEDKYLSGIPIDLSKVMFTFSANHLDRIDRILLDRMIVVNLQGYNNKEKAAIAENYLIPSALKEVDLAEKVGIQKEVITHIIETYASEETGVRELKRCIEQITQKINMLRMFNTKDLPFYIKEFTLPFVLKKEHVDLFLKKKPVNNSAIHMYT
jgi:hypothetical protein